MQFKDVYMSQFTTGTTCYSGVRNSRCKNLRLATENHVLAVRLIPPNEDGDNSETKTIDVQVSCENLPHYGDSTSMICVGFSQWDEQLQALAMVDPVQMEDPLLQESPHLYHPPSIDKEDSMSVVSHAYSVPDSSASVLAPNHRRSGSATAASSGTMTSSTASVSTATTSNTSNNNTSNSNNNAPTHKKTNSEPSGGTDSTNTVGFSLPPVSTIKKARLVLQNGDEKYFVFVDFRPLCPCIVRWGKNKEKVGIWVGSAEDSQLRLYVPQTEGGGDRVLQLCPLPEEHFTVDSPIMALDFSSTPNNNDGDDTIHTLAIACQDGTIHLMSWKGDGFDDLNSFTMIVDGPLVCLRLEQQEHSLHVVIGSLCGYVCQLVKRENKTWEGPFMVVQGFWNEAVEAEDSVLAVHSTCGGGLDNDNEYIAIGTHSGRCLLYCRRKQLEKYEKVWECVLNYCIHGIVMVLSKSSSGDDGANRMLRLVVTTRRSLHVFELEKDNTIESSRTEGMVNTEVTSNAMPSYSADLAKERLLKLLPAKHETSTITEGTVTSSVTEDAALENKQDNLGQQEDNGVQMEKKASSQPPPTDDADSGSPPSSGDK